jgi:hypothetical protein
MSKGIRISKKYGANPTIPICFWCGNEKNEVALLGQLKDDKEAPRNCVLDYEPCEECQKNMSLGVTLIGTLRTPINETLPPIKNTEDEVLYPTGQWLVVTKEAAKRYFGEVVTEEEIENTDKVLVEQEFIDFLNAEFLKIAEEDAE